MRWGPAAAALGLLLAGLAACSSGSSPAWHTLGDGERLVHLAPQPDALLGAGSVTTAGNRVPALWRTTDGAHWTALTTLPRSPYGELSELTTMATTPDGRAAAIGQAVGGTHGNPRVGSWYLDGTTLTEVPADVELYGGPRQGAVNEMGAGPSGFLVAGFRTDRNEHTGAAVWTSPDARQPFTIHDADPALESGPGETVRAVAAAGGAHGFLVGGDRFVNGTGRVDGDALLWTSPDGATWQRVSAAPGVFDGPGSELAQAATPWNDGWAVAGVDSGDGRTTVVVWATRDGSTWERHPVDALGSDPDPLSAATSLAVVGDHLVVGARLGSGLALATSADARSWSRLALPAGTPSGEHATIVAAGVGDRLVVAATGDDSPTRVWTRPA